MKTLRMIKLFPGRACLLCAALSAFAHGLASAHAQSLGECTERVLSSPTESSVKVRLIGVNQWPVNPICFWSASGVAADGSPYRWDAVLIGDGLVENPPPFPTYVNAAAIFRYTGPLGCSSKSVNYFPPYPSAPFTNHVTSEGPFLEPTCAQDGPPLSFRGTLSLDAENNFTVDITFTGGMPPLPSINDLIALVDGSSLSRRQKRPLLATLEAARDSLASGNCETGVAQLRAFQNKVDTQVRVSDAVLADALIATAQAIIDSACSD